MQIKPPYPDIAAVSKDSYELLSMRGFFGRFCFDKYSDNHNTC